MQTLVERSYRLEEVGNVAEELLPFILERKRVLFKGEIGSGKTTLIQHLSELMGVSEIVDSPTFSLVNEYEGNETIHHFDLYRIETEEELWDIGWNEYLETTGQLWVEWPERAPGAFDDSFLLVQITHDQGGESRMLQVISLD